MRVLLVRHSSAVQITLKREIRPVLFIMKAYNEAVQEDYRFGTYGDAMLILND